MLILRERWKRWLLLLLMWTLFGVLFEAAGYFPAIGLGRPPEFPWWQYFQWGITQLYIWWALTPAVAWLVRRYPVERRRLVRSLLIYVPAGLAVMVVWAGVFSLLYWALGGPRAPREFSSVPLMWKTELLRRFGALLTVYAVIVVALHALDYYRKYRDREYRLAEARLQTLKMQLQPHFLFNTLHSISTLMHEDVEAADRMVVSLGDLLRTTLQEGDAHEVPLRRELELLDLYLRIQRIRFQDRLRVTVEAGPEVLGARVPNLILQPLVENAIKHGIAPHALDGHVEIAARREGASLALSVRDDGPGALAGSASPSSSPPPGEGVGLANTRARLRHLYGAEHRFETGAAPGGGYLVELRIPYRECAEEGANA